MRLNITTFRYESKSKSCFIHPLPAHYFILAYLRYIPTELFFVPFFDSIGHFVLYGLWGYFFARAFDKTVFSVGKVQIQRGIIIALIIAVVEESLQFFSAARTFSFFDMGWGVLGIVVACAVSNLNQKKNEKQEGNTKKRIIV